MDVSVVATQPGFTARPPSRGPHAERLARWCANIIGAASAAIFAYSFLRFYIESHRPIGILFFAQQTFVAIAYLIRRPARVATRRVRDWILAFTGTFVGVLFRPTGEHPVWGLWSGTALQVVAVVGVTTCIVTLGRSFGFAAADRGVVSSGQYAVVRHPMYGWYVVLETGYLLQSLSVRNAVVLMVGTLCNAGRAVAEEHLLANNETYRTYRRRVRRRMLPGVW